MLVWVSHLLAIGHIEGCAFEHWDEDLIRVQCLDRKRCLFEVDPSLDHDRGPSCIPCTQEFLVGDVHLQGVSTRVAQTIQLMRRVQVSCHRG